VRIVIDGNNSEDQDWDLTHKLARIHARGNDSITKEEALCEVWAEIQRRFVPDDLLNKIITFIDEDKFDALDREIFNSELTERIKQQIGNLNWFDSLEKELLNALRRDEIKCLGINSNTCKREEITAMEWVDLKFYYGIPTLEAGPEYCTSGIRWYRLKFQADKINRVCPTSEDLKKQYTKRKNTGNKLQIFLDMDTLSWDEIELILLPNQKIQINARDQRTTIHYTALGITLKPYKILLILANGERILKSQLQPVNRLKKSLKENLGIYNNPFEQYIENTGYIPIFKLSEKISGSIGKDGSQHSVSFEDGRVDHQPHKDYDEEDDPAGVFLREND